MMVGQERQFAESAGIREAAAADLMDFAQKYGAWAASKG
jgi:hypothetical protein